MMSNTLMILFRVRGVFVFSLNSYCKSNYTVHIFSWSFPRKRRGRRGLDRMVVGFITTYAISAYRQ
jgi:hypothetical protein